MTTGIPVRLESLSKVFRESGLVLAPLDLEIRAGEFVSFLGPSGCGKSTLLRIIAGLETPTTGSLQIDDTGLTFYKAFVFQEAALLPWRTALENVMVPLELMGKSESDARVLAEAALNRVRLGESGHLLPAQLSGGMKMRCSLARALVVEPKLLLLDEPFAALDENTRHHLQEDVRRLWLESKMTVIFVTHSVSEAVFVSDRSIVFSPRPGKVIADMNTGLTSARTASLRLTQEYVQGIARVSEAFR